MSEQHNSSGRKRFLAARAEVLSRALSIPTNSQSLPEMLELNAHIGAESRDDAKFKALLGVFCIPKQQGLEQGARDFLQHVMDSYGGYGQENGILELQRNRRKHN